jgi:hypothetical protein
MGVLIPIIDGALNHGVDYAEHARTFIAAYARRAQITLPPMDGISDTDPLAARVDAGRWIVECPDCHDAQYVWPDEPEPLFMCVSCFNTRADGAWRRVAIPAERVAIEAMLLEREMPITRGWVPGETADDLRAENVAHGIGG